MNKSNHMKKTHRMQNKSRLNTQEIKTIITRTAEGITPNAIGKELKRCNKTVSAVLMREGISAEVEVVRQKLADRYEELNHRLLDSISNADISKINAYQRIVGCGILTDKVRLLRGQSTSNSISVLLARHVNINEPAPSDRPVIVLDDEI